MTIRFLQEFLARSASSALDNKRIDAFNEEAFAQ